MLTNIFNYEQIFKVNEFLEGHNVSSSKYLKNRVPGIPSSSGPRGLQRRKRIEQSSTNFF